MGKKPQYATTQDLDDAQAALEKKAQDAKTSGEKAAADVRAEMRKEFEKHSGIVTDNAKATKQVLERVEQDGKQFSVSQVEAAKQQVLDELPPLEERMQLSVKKVEDRITNLDEELKQMVGEELGELAQGIDDQMGKMREELMADAEKWAREAAEALVNQRKELDGMFEKLRLEFAKKSEEDKIVSAEARNKLVEEQNGARTEMQERNERSQTELWLKLERLDDLIKECREGASGEAKSLDAKTASSLKDFRTKAESRLDALDTQAEKLHDAVAEVENISTRRVDWVIKNVSKRLRPPSASKACLHTSWFSPKFDVAGAHGVQLELQLFKPSDPPVEGEAAGDCAAYLWACKGMNLVFKLYIGSRSQQLEKVFNGRVPYGTKRLCFLKDQINREEDSVRISVEILEAVREIEHPIKPPALLDEAGEELKVDERSRPLEGKVVFRRHLNHRLVDQVRGMVDTMRSQMVRRVEWRLESASMLRKCFPPGEAMCSVAFSAAGVDNLQLMFYPCGYAGVTDGFCSLFLFAPAGATLKYTLFAGTHRRDATHFFEDQGAFGRSNYCRFDSIIEEDTDSIFLALDIEEAHQDIVSKVSHPLVQAGDRRSQAQIDASVPKAVESVVKMHRAPNKPPGAALEEKRVLPSLWTAKSLGEQKEPVMKDMADLTQKGQSLNFSSGKRPQQPQSPTAVASPLAMSRSSPNLTKEFSNNQTTPLPAMSKTTGSDFTASVGSKKVRASSNTRQGGANTMQVLQPGV